MLHLVSALPLIKGVGGRATSFINLQASAFNIVCKNGAGHSTSVDFQLSVRYSFTQKMLSWKNNPLQVPVDNVCDPSDLNPACSVEVAAQNPI